MEVLLAVVIGLESMFFDSIRFYKDEGVSNVKLMMIAEDTNGGLEGCVPGRWFH